ncbi:MAG: SURF1 family protein [Luteimonas sp.]
MTRQRTMLFGWVLALVAMTLFSIAGAWQWRRMHEKQASLDAAQHVLADRTAKPLSIAADNQRMRAYDWSAGAGTFDARGALLLDNQQNSGRSGIRVYRIFVPEQGNPLLVDLGWLPLGGDRKFPDIARIHGPVELRGLLMPPPSSGLPLGAGVVRQGDGWLLTRVDPVAIASSLRLPVPLAPRVLRLDPALPQRHLGYAVQWFALALAVLVTACILTFRKIRR